MKKHILILSFFLIGSLAQVRSNPCNTPDPVRKSGRTVIQDRRVAYFNGLVINGPFELILNQGSSVELKVEADEQIVDKVITNVKNNALMVFSRETLKDAGTVKIHLTFVRLDQIRVSGPVTFQSGQKLNFEALDFELNGAPAGNLTLEAKSVKANINGSATLKLHGMSLTADIRIGGACILDARDFSTDTVTAVVEGSATVQISAKNALNARVRESGLMEYLGDPKITKEISGVGNLRRLESK